MKFIQKTNADGGKYLVRVASNGAECHKIALAKCDNAYTKEERDHLKECLEVYLDWVENYLTLECQADHLGIEVFNLKGKIATGKAIWESVEWSE